MALYGFVALSAPQAFTNLPALHGDFAASSGNLIYFSFVTLTTTGYGDIAPLCIRMRAASPMSRQLSVKFILRLCWRGS